MYPVILFTYKRVDTLKQVLYALKNQSKPIDKLIIFSDSAKVCEEESEIQEVRDILYAIDWAEPLIIKRKVNMGESDSLITGITEVLNEYEQAIILEDNILPVSHFYESMCILLENYKNTKSIFSVGGYPSIRNDGLPEYQFDAIISARFSIYGWGTWADRWAFMKPKIHFCSDTFNNLEQILPHDAKPSGNYDNEYYRTNLCLTLLSQQHDFRHVHTKHYMVKDMTIDITSHSHMNPITNIGQFFAEHNRLEDIIPTKLPSKETDYDKIDRAVQDYYNDISENI